MGDQGPEVKKVAVKKSTFNAMIAGMIVIVGVAAFFAGSYMTSLDSDSISQQDLEEAIAKMELRILQDRLPTQQQPQQPQLPARISIDDDPIIGDHNAPITIIEFSDFQCPFCARFNAQTLPMILEEYIDQGKVRLVFRDFPIQNIHPNALPASIAAECANEQGKFKEMHDKLFENQSKWNSQGTDMVLSQFSQYASEIGLENEKFDLCLTSGKYIEEIKNDLEDGRNYGVSGTPGFFIGNDEVGYVELKGAQPFESFKRVIDMQLEA